MKAELELLLTRLVLQVRSVFKIKCRGLGCGFTRDQGQGRYADHRVAAAVQGPAVGQVLVVGLLQVHGVVGCWSVQSSGLDGVGIEPLPRLISI